MLKDSSGYEFDPTVVVAMVTWIESAAKQLGVAIADLAVDEVVIMPPMKAGSKK